MFEIRQLLHTVKINELRAAFWENCSFPKVSKHRGPTQKERLVMFQNYNGMYGKAVTFLLDGTIVSYIHIYVQNKRKLTSIVVPCRPCSSERRILAILRVFAMLSTVH